MAMNPRKQRAKNIKIGLIGAGNRANGLGRYLRACKGVAIAGICDPDSCRLDNLANDYGLPQERRFTDYRDLMAIRDINAVVITSPDHTHYEIAMEAARKKKHIFCEKPMALSLKHCMAMQKEAQNNKIRLMVGFCLRYNNLYRKAKELIANGVVGRIQLVSAADSVERGSAYFFHSWHRLKSQSGGLLLQKATHSLDIVNWMVGSRPISVYAIGGLDVFGGHESNEKTCHECNRKQTCPEFINAERYHGDYLSGHAFVVADKCVYAEEIDVSDNAALLIRYANGTKASFVECHFTPDYKREFSFIGDKGRLDITDYYSHNGQSKPCHEIVVSRRHTAKIVKYHVKLKGGGHGGGDPAIMDEFIEVLRGHRMPLADGMAGVMSTAIADAAEISMQSGRVAVINGITSIARN